MGVKGLFRFIKQVAASHQVDAIKEKSIEDYQGQTMLIDALQKIYSVGISIRDSGKDKLSPNDAIINHYYAIINYTMFLIKKKITPIYVFEGSINVGKEDAISDRNDRKLTSYDICNKIDDMTSDDFIKYFKRSYNVNNTNIHECMVLLDAFGIPYVKSKGEAESQCAKIALYDNHVGGIITNDIDTLLFGAKTYCRDFSGATHQTNEIHLDQILIALLFEANQIRKDNNMKPLNHFTFDNFVEFASMLKTDYYKGLCGVQNDIIFKLFVLSSCDIDLMMGAIDEYNENNDNVSKIIRDSDFIEKWANVVSYYKNAQSVDLNKIDKKIKQPNAFLIHRILSFNGFTDYFIDNLIDELNQFYNYNNDHHCAYNHNPFYNNKSFNSYHRKYVNRMKSQKQF